MSRDLIEVATDWLIQHTKLATIKTVAAQFPELLPAAMMMLVHPMGEFIAVQLLQLTIETHLPELRGTRTMVDIKAELQRREKKLDDLCDSGGHTVH
jgi:hypothetical protein